MTNSTTGQAAALDTTPTKALLQVIDGSNGRPAWRCILITDAGEISDIIECDVRGLWGSGKKNIKKIARGCGYKGRFQKVSSGKAAMDQAMAKAGNEFALRIVGA